jgi:hypothetical protein
MLSAFVQKAAKKDNGAACRCPVIRRAYNSRNARHGRYNAE